MAYLDDLFAAMPAAAAAAVHEPLVIDPTTRQITVPADEAIFGVTADGNAERKYFECPRYVGDGLDLAACFLRINFQNANGERDGYLIKDTAINGELITFSWELSHKVTAYKGSVQFVLCASLPGSAKTADWHTTLVSGTVLEGLETDAAIVEAAMSDLIAQLIALTESQSDKVTAEGAKQTAALQAAAAAATDEAKAEISARGEAVLASLPAEYTELANTVDKLSRDRAGAIICAAEGSTIQLQDSSDDYLAGLRIFGKSTQDGTPTPEAPVEIVSTPAPVVTVTDGTGENVQTVAVTTPGSLPGIPVESGGNYTDADGQEWICDEVDLARGVYVQRIKRYVFNGTETWNYAPTGVTRFLLQLPDANIDDGNSSRKYPMLCTHYRPGSSQDVYTTDKMCAISTGTLWVSDTAYTDVVSWAEHLANDQVLIAYVLAEPAETALTAEEIAAFATLHSNKPVTTILNDAGAHMAVEYVADTKTYIDNKFAALTAAIAKTKEATE